VGRFTTLPSGSATALTVGFLEGVDPLVRVVGLGDDNGSFKFWTEGVGLLVGVVGLGDGNGSFKFWTPPF